MDGGKASSSEGSYHQGQRRHAHCSRAKTQQPNVHTKGQLCMTACRSYENFANASADILIFHSRLYAVSQYSTQLPVYIKCSDGMRVGTTAFQHYVPDVQSMREHTSVQVLFTPVTLGVVVVSFIVNGRMNYVRSSSDLNFRISSLSAASIPSRLSSP